MKKIVYFLLLLSICNVSTAQEKKARLIVRGDDMGFSHAGNEALIKVYKSGIETSIEVIVASPWFPEAVKLLAQNPGIDVGVHLALTSEWENIKWRPLTDCPSLKDRNGYFFPMVYPNKNYPGKSISENQWKLADIEKEFRAQIELAKRKIPRLSHISSHMGCTDLNKEVSALVKKLMVEYNIDIDLKEAGVKYTGYKGPNGTMEQKLKSFLNMLDSLEPGQTYLFVDHPALDGPEMRAVYHIGYENVAEDRQGVTDVWINPLVVEAIKKKNIQLISYADLKKK
ncbi:MAG: ChbG/HpnK family deacetylase [Ferruginibacter sp.]|nr:ChbG/HpnK family deacetylase [Ferruginibacter sp.]